MNDDGKMCTQCGEWKPITDFSKHKRYKGGRVNHCARCRSIYSKKYYQKNKNRNEIVYPEKKTCSKCGEEKESSNFHKNRGNIDGLHTWCRKCRWCERTISGHLERGCIINLSIDELIPVVRDATRCFLCKCRLSWDIGSGFNDATPTLDRVNNDNVLAIDTVQVICRKCNATKLNRSMKEFVEYCKMIVNDFGDLSWVLKG